MQSMNPTNTTEANKRKQICTVVQIQQYAVTSHRAKAGRKLAPNDL